MPTSPNVENYYIGKGIVSFKKEGEADYRDLGNVTTFEFTPAIEKLEHFSSRQGVRTKDRTVVTSKSATVRIVAEEWTVENLQVALLGGDVEVGSDGDDVFEIFKANAISGSLKFTGTNEVGPKYEIILPDVDFIPQTAVNPISEEWGTLELNGDVNAVPSGGFGTMRKIAEEASST